MPRHTAFAVLTAALAASSASGQTTAPAVLSIGDPAPPLVPGAWLKGTPVTRFEPGKVYVVEFWATWCGPCREAIPHLTALAKTHPAVTFIGQDVLEEDDTAPKPFVEKMGDRMDYHVALDDKAKDPDGAMVTAWLKAAGLNTIPTTFIVGPDAKIAWIGRPLMMDAVLEQVVSGKYDVKAIAEHTREVNGVESRMIRAADAKDVDGALRAVKDMVALEPSMAEPLAGFEFDLLARNGRMDDARARAERICTDSKSPAALNDVAWTLSTRPSPTADDVKIARKAIDRAIDMPEGRTADLFDTSARVYAAAAQWDKAVEQQQTAVSLAEADAKASLRSTLDAYQKHQLPAPH